VGAFTWENPETLQAALSLALECAGGVVYSRRPEPPYRITRVSPEVESLLGLTSQALTDDDGDWMRRVHPDDRPTVLAGLAGSARSPMRSQHLHYRLLAGDGTWRWLADICRCISDSVSGRRQLVGLWRLKVESDRVELALQSEQTRVRAILDSAVEGIITLDREGRVSTLNLAAQWIFGYTPAELSGQHFTALLPEEDRGRFEGGGGIESAVPESNPSLSGLQIRGLRRDGLVFPLEVSLSEIPGGAMERWTAICRDVTERRAAARRLRASEARFRAVVEDQTELICRFLPNGALTFCNQAFCRYFGLDERAVFGRRFPDLLSAPDAAELEETIGALRPDNNPVEAEYHSVRPSGEDAWQLWTLRGLFDTEEGLGEVQAVGRDTTERRLGERALHQSEERYRQLLEGSLQGVCIHRDWSLLFVNQAYAEMLGYDSPREVLDLGTMEALVAPRELPRLKAYAEARLAGREAPWRYEYEAIGRDGRYLRVENIVRLVPWEGAVAFQVSAIDVSARHDAEVRARQLQAELAHAARLSTVGEIASNVAHELNQPLCAATAYAQTAAALARSAPHQTERLVEIMDQVVLQAERAGQIVRHVRELVRKGESDKQLLNIDSVLREAINLLEAEARAKGFRFDVELNAPQAPLRINRIQIQQVILNLALNAMEAMTDTPANARLVHISSRTDGPEAVRVTVSDHGPGIPPDALERIFEPFQSGKREGMGMGLSISRSIIQAHGGKLWAESPGDGGAVFHFVVPAHD
jgi:PAS domain S-box-containing protein